jgi:hypothetical protein
VCKFLPGVITGLCLASANAQEHSLLPELVELTSGIIVGDRNYHSPKTKEALASMAVELVAPYSSKKRDSNPIALCSDIGPLLLRSSSVAVSGVPNPPAICLIQTSQRWSNFIDYRFKSSALLSSFRYRIDTVFSQLSGRYSVKRVRARDLWHLASRLLRKVLSHTVAFLLDHRSSNPSLQLAKLLH